MDRQHVAALVIVNWLNRAWDYLRRCAGFPGDASPSLLPADDDFTPAERDSIRQSLWRLRQDLDRLGVPTLLQDMAKLMDDSFGGPQGFIKVVKAWAKLIDALVQETERQYGSQPGRGPLKKRNVKSALLYLVQRSKVDAPDIPIALAPFVWNILLDSLIDLIAQFTNRQNLWGTVPVKPSGRQRVNLEMQRLGSGVDSLGRGLARMSWALIHFFSPVAPAMKQCVDEFLRADPQPVQTVFVLSRWVAQHTGTLVVASDILAVAVEQSRFLVHAGEDRRLAFARELVLDFIQEEMDVPDRDSLEFRILQAAVEIGIDLVSMLIDRHRDSAAESVAPPDAQPIAPAA